MSWAVESMTFLDFLKSCNLHNGSLRLISETNFLPEYLSTLPGTDREKTSQNVDSECLQ